MTRGMLLALAASVALLAQAPSLSGSVYRNTGMSDSALAVGGALVYVRPTDNTTDWSGPALTDAYGRFTFPSLRSTQYLLRIYTGKQLSWQQVVTVPPAVLRPIVLPATP
jgi:hypothetical protein